MREKCLSDFLSSGCLMDEVQAKSDWQLLSEFARDGEQAAFRELVTRHADFVYSSALRQVESTAVAADLAQQVFTSLAQKAASIATKIDTGGSLLGWLHRATRYAALNHIRDDRRRREHERQAMEQLITNTQPAADWEQIRPILDEALDSLGDEDREAVLLRYFKNQDFRTVGLALGVSDDTAQKRVSRAVERLREFFLKQKITIGAAGLTVLISVNAVQSAPLGLVATISAAALAGTAVATSTAIATTTKTIVMTTLHKTLLTVTVAALAGAGVYEVRQNSKMRGQIQTLQLQQAPLAGAIQLLQGNFTMATNRVADLLAENSRLKSNQSEVLKLRSEMTRLRNNLAALAQLKTDSELKDNSSGATSAYIPTAPLSERINRIQMNLRDHPEAGIPEIQFASPVKWLNSVQGPVETDGQLSNALTLLRRQAMSGFMSDIRMAELQFETANDGRFPSELAQLLPYLDGAKGQVMLDNYEIVPAKTITDPNAHITGDWVIVRKTRVNPSSNSSMERLAAYAGGESAWYASDNRD